MRSPFFGYYRPSDQELETLWAHCLFVLDTNVLLSLYRYSKDVSEDLLQAIQRISGRLWIPHQVALEYQRNRTSVIADQVKRYDEVRHLLSKVQGSLSGGLANLQLEKRHYSIDPSTLLNKVNDAFSQFENELAKLEQQHPDVYDDDQIRDKLDTILEGKIGPPPSSQEYLDRLYEEGQNRYARRRPPGYVDLDKTQDDGTETYVFGDLRIRSEYSDLILWKQILEEARNRKQLKHLIFVTDDEKEDWWWTVKSRGPKRLGPRPELAEEIASESGISLFYMYNSDQFLEYARRYLNITVKQESVDQVRDVARLSEREAVRSRYNEWRERAYSAEQAVLDWLQSLYPSNEIVRGHRGFPDFTVIGDAKGNREGFDVGFTRNPRSVMLRMRDIAYRGYYEVNEGNLDAFNLVLVLDDEGDLAQATRALDSGSFVVPSGVSVILGTLVADDEKQGTPSRFILLREYEGPGQQDLFGS